MLINKCICISLKFRLNKAFTWMRTLPAGVNFAHVVQQCLDF